jgi:hypothetical protein
MDVAENYDHLFSGHRSPIENQQQKVNRANMALNFTRSPGKPLLSKDLP